MTDFESKFIKSIQVKPEIDYEQVANGIVRSICRGVKGEMIDIAKSGVWKNAEIMKLVRRDIAEKRYESKDQVINCLSKNNALLKFVTLNYQQEAIIELLEWLIVFNQDNGNSDLINRLYKQLSDKQVSELIFQAAQIWYANTISELAEKKVGIKSEAAIIENLLQRGIINSIPILSGMSGQFTWDEAYWQLLNKFDLDMAIKFIHLLQLMGNRKLDNLGNEWIDRKLEY